MGRAYSFGPFVLDGAERRLLRDGRPVDVSGRYFDALVLLASEDGRLVTKERFHQEVWRGIPVTDEALTQCIRSLRKALDDDAAAPRYIETVPRHGYRFIAPLDGPREDPAPHERTAWSLHATAQDAVAAAIGGGVAGVIGALLYLSAGLVTPRMGTASTLLVLVSINLFLGVLGGAAVGLGLAAGRRSGRGAWRLLAGGAAGGLIVGSFAHMIGADLFELLFGRSPGAITGAAEGATLGLATGAGLALASRTSAHRLWLRGTTGFLAGATGGAAIAAAGGKLMVGSLAELALRFPSSRLGIDQASAGMAGGTSRLALAIVTTLEGALFVGTVVAALMAAERLRSDNS
ncbi:hypothetical protein GCM10011515_12810 [Tsuneonella deserti]|uniref:OmpR/PhoB-type domain-containing protein n=1 Tax=Tsuneonella deserti TaxID=2035528 RepID=A0ABQ1S5Q8_9SPHN|nr:transcriptional regulator [Tsuneonella deserti]GGD94418.1 hypothetical protein GCM10011515_12810 [Tsuneonella deserti]